MTTYTKAQLATRVLRDLGLLAAEENPSAIDLSWAEETVTAEIALLSSKGFTIWNGSDSSVPPEYLTALSRRIGLAVGPSFGLFDIASAQNAMPLAEADLRRLTMPAPSYQPVQIEYF